MARSDDPLRCSTLDATDAPGQGGNRFDVPNLGVCYFATELRGCFAETLARFRPSATMRVLLEKAPDWTNGKFMAVGDVPADWRQRRVAVRVELDQPYAFVDVEHPQTHGFLTQVLARQLAEMGVEHLDVATVRGPDRRVTRLLAAWAARPTPTRDERFAGIRYASHLGSWECWAAFEGLPMKIVERRPIFDTTGDLLALARVFGLQVR